MSHWPQEWTNKIEALRKYLGQGWEEDVRMLNCLKMYGLSKAEDGSLIIRDHMSKGEQFFFGCTIAIKTKMMYGSGISGEVVHVMYKVLS